MYQNNDKNTFKYELNTLQYSQKQYTMSESSPIREVENQPPVETVRCIIENMNGKILLLQKAPDSKASNLFEFPGGKIDDIAGNMSTPDEQLRAVTNEVLEETGIDLSDNTPQKLDEFEYDFSAKGKNYKRRVHMFHLRLHSDHEIAINTTADDEGQSEDKHAQSVWVTRDELLSMKQNGELSGNSIQFEETLRNSAELSGLEEQPVSED